MKTVTPTHYIIQLLETKLPNDTNWKPIEHSQEYQAVRLGVPSYFIDPKNHLTHYPVKVDDLAVYEINNNFHRCKVLEIFEKK